VFVDGVEFEAVYETTEGSVWLLCGIKIRGDEIFFDGLLVYPVTGKRLVVGTAQMRSIFRSVEDAARLQGFSRCFVSALRTTGAAPGRIIRLVRRLT